MSAVQTLPPDQRAVLQLILKQGRGYAELSGLLRIDEAAVRARALAGLETLGAGAGEALSPERRAQVADYLLGQQAGAELDATRTYLHDSAAARRWAAVLRTQLAPVARDPLPEIPTASANGHASVAAPGIGLEPAGAPAPDRTGDEPEPPAGAPPADDPRRAAAPSTARAARTAQPAPAAPRRSSKVGGIVLIVGLAVLLAVLLIVLIGGGDDDDPSSSAPPPAATQGAAGGAQTTDGDGDGDGDGGATAPQTLAQVNLNATDAGSEAAGIGWVQRVDGRPMIAVQVQRIAPNGEQDVYAAWLRATGGRARFLGFVPSQVGRNRSFTVSANLPGNFGRFDEVLITRETITTTQTPTDPREVVLSGALRLRG